MTSIVNYIHICAKPYSLEILSRLAAQRHYRNVSYALQNIADFSSVQN